MVPRGRWSTNDCFFLYFCLQEAAMLAFHWSRKILRILLIFCPSCGIHDNAKAAQPESADAACFPLTSQHSSVQTHAMNLSMAVGHLSRFNSFHNTSTVMWSPCLGCERNGSLWQTTEDECKLFRSWAIWTHAIKNIPTSTVQPSSLGLLERSRSMSIASKLLSKNWLDNPRTSASLIWPVSRFGLTRIAWPSRWCQ